MFPGYKATTHGTPPSCSFTQGHESMEFHTIL